MNKSVKDLRLRSQIKPGQVAAPGIEWLEDGVPKSNEFGDTYFSRAGGLAETRHVFLGGNGLPDRFAGRNEFTIGELGFGTGLNFLTVLDSLKQLNAAPQVTFVSFELYPMTAAQLERAVEPFSEIAALSKQLVQVWSPSPGWNEMVVDGCRLCLGVGDARHLIADLLAASASKNERGGQPEVSQIDAWFLDGFSPSKNPELWGEELLREVANLTSSGGTLATYTAAGWVRRNLQAAGFDVEKCKGFAGKREMVVGRKPG